MTYKKDNCVADLYVKETQAGVCAKEGEPVVEKESAATALVNGNNVLGPVVGNYCMSLAVKKAKDVGIGWVVAHGKSNTPHTFKSLLSLYCISALAKTELVKYKV